MQIQQIVNYEEEIYSSLKAKTAEEWEAIAKGNPALLNLDITETPGLITAYKEIRKQKLNTITPEFAYKLYDTYGLDADIISSLADVLKFKFEVQDFQKGLEEAKARSKEQTALHRDFANVSDDLKPTDDAFKYDYSKKSGKYVFKNLEVSIEKIIRDGAFVKQVAPNVQCSLVLDRTNFYTESGGQIGDRGKINLKNGVFEVSDVQKLKSCVLHRGVFKTDQKTALLKPGDVGKSKIDEELRLNLMRNHTGVHLLNSALKRLKGVACQKSSNVVGDYLSFDVGVFGEKLSVEDVKALEGKVNKVIKDGVEVKTTVVDGLKLLEYDDVVLIPGEVYPEEGVRLVEVVGKDGFVSR